MLINSRSCVLCLLDAPFDAKNLIQADVRRDPTDHHLHLADTLSWKLMIRRHQMLLAVR